MTSIVFATNNSNKIYEIKQLIPNQFEIKSLKDINCFVDIPETGDTIKENAFIKANYIYENFHENVFADDTGLEVDALDGAPGVYSARYAGQQRNAKDNNEKLLNQLSENALRSARFKTVIALIINGNTYFYEGVCEGHIAETPRGTNGFGYDPIFIPLGYNITFAEMDLDEKNKISHRGKAIQKLVRFLNSN
ncbi:non-canonical purine NTP diphosphatase [Aegicerativicinus sediminis]|uniref:non-canonical purine NTP diphosphatase n=1 Tax=Aegicerativicinus sediminis TaxID=2893202 RepID=UPI001E5B5F48|nr:non-canonical purine NTP diphosphatase [Aegicerativicinus sediminis]